MKSNLVEFINRVLEKRARERKRERVSMRCSLERLLSHKQERLKEEKRAQISFRVTIPKYRFQISS